MYQCPNGENICGFGQKPDRCKHGEWIRSGAAAPSAEPMRFKISREAAAKILGIRGQPAPPENLWVRNVAPRESVRQEYATHRAGVAAAKRQRRTMPLGPCVVDADGVPRSAAEFLAGNS